MIRRLKKDVLTELPSKRRQKVTIEPDKKIMKDLKLLMKAMRGDLGDDITLEEVFQQCFGGQEKKPTKIKGGRENIIKYFRLIYHKTGEAKIKGALGFINDLIQNDLKFLVFAHHRIVLDGIEEEMKKKKQMYIRIDGSVS